MSVEFDLVARAILETAYHGKNRATVRIDIGRWTESEVQGLASALIAGQKEYGVRLKGVRTDSSGFAKFGISRDTSNSGRFEGVPIVMTIEADFDDAEFVIEPA